MELPEIKKIQLKIENTTKNFMRIAAPVSDRSLNGRSYKHLPKVFLNSQKSK
jgi:hypothetical protein